MPIGILTKINWRQTLDPNPGIWDSPITMSLGVGGNCRHFDPMWTALPEAAKSCYELISCGCKKGCNVRCKCKNASLKYTALCGCDGDCSEWFKTMLNWYVSVLFDLPVFCWYCQ